MADTHSIHRSEYGPSSDTPVLGSSDELRVIGAAVDGRLNALAAQWVGVNSEGADVELLRLRARTQVANELAELQLAGRLPT